VNTSSEQKKRIPERAGQHMIPESMHSSSRHHTRC